MRPCFEKVCKKILEGAVVAFVLICSGYNIRSSELFNPPPSFAQTIGLTWHCLQLQSEHLNAISSFLDHRTAVDDFLGGPRRIICHRAANT